MTLNANDAARRVEGPAVLTYLQPDAKYLFSRCDDIAPSAHGVTQTRLRGFGSGELFVPRGHALQSTHINREVLVSGFYVDE